MAVSSFPAAPLTELDFEALAKKIEALRAEALFGGSLPEGCIPPQAEQFFLLAIDALSSAQRFAMLAHYNFIRKD